MSQCKATLGRGQDLEVLLTVLPRSGEVTQCPRVRSLIPAHRALYKLDTREQPLHL